jgi:orotate phosphoribosyltransferase
VDRPTGGPRRTQPVDGRGQAVIGTCDAVVVTDADLARRVRDCCRLTGSFVLRSGRVANEYFDKYQFEADPALLGELADAMVPLIPEGTEVLAGLEMGGIAVVTALGQRAGLPCAFVRKAAKTYGTARLAEGAEVRGRRVLVVEDVVTSGGQIAISAGQLRELGAWIGHALCVIDRQEGGAGALAGDGIRLHALLRREELDQA